MFRHLVDACAVVYVINVVLLARVPWYASIWTEAANWSPYVGLWGPYIVPPASWRALSWEPWMTAAEIARLIAVLVCGLIAVWARQKWGNSYLVAPTAVESIVDDSEAVAVRQVVEALGKPESQDRLVRLKTCMHMLPSTLTIAQAEALLVPLSGDSRLKGIKMLRRRLPDTNVDFALLLNGLDERRWSEGLKVLNKRRWHF